MAIHSQQEGNNIFNIAYDDVSLTSELLLSNNDLAYLRNRPFKQKRSILNFRDSRRESVIETEEVVPKMDIVLSRSFLKNSNAIETT